MGVGLLMGILIVVAVIFTIFYFSDFQLLKAKSKKTIGFHRNFIDYPDSPRHSCAVVRAWDRYLVSLGLLPIGTADLSKVGPILQEPDGEYLEYGFNDCGHLELRIETVQKSELPKDSGPT